MSDFHESPTSTSDSHESSTSISTAFNPPSKTSEPLAPQTSTTAPASRSRGRNVYIYDANDPTAVLGSLRLTNGVTNADLYSMVEILIIPTDDFSLQDESYFFL